MEYLRRRQYSSGVLTPTEITCRTQQSTANPDTTDTINWRMNEDVLDEGSAAN